MSGLTWVHTVCEGYQQTTLVGKELISVLLKIATIIMAFQLFLDI